MGMKRKKELKHKIKQADTLETSRKTLQKALMGALHNGGFLFARNPEGLFTPVLVNARIADIVGAAIAFAASRANTTAELQDLKNYLLGAVTHTCHLREMDIEGAGKGAANHTTAAIPADGDNGSPGTGSEE